MRVNIRFSIMEDESKRHERRVLDTFDGAAAIPAAFQRPDGSQKSVKSSRVADEEISVVDFLAYLQRLYVMEI